MGRPCRERPYRSGYERYERCLTFGRRRIIRHVHRRIAARIEVKPPSALKYPDDAIKALQAVGLVVEDEKAPGKGESAISRLRGLGRVLQRACCEGSGGQPGEYWVCEDCNGKQVQIIRLFSKILLLSM